MATKSESTESVIARIKELPTLPPECDETIKNLRGVLTDGCIDRIVKEGDWSTIWKQLSKREEI